MVHLIDTELGVDGNARISSLPTLLTPNQDKGGKNKIARSFSLPTPCGCLLCMPRNTSSLDG